MLQDEHYRRLVARVAELAREQAEGEEPRYQPRGLANTLWGLAGGRGQGRAVAGGAWQGSAWQGGPCMCQPGRLASAPGQRMSATSPPSPRTPPPPAALGDVGSAGLAFTLAERVRQFPHTAYRPQELSNVVWALGTLGVLCQPTLDAVLAGVRRRRRALRRCGAAGPREAPGVLLPSRRRSACCREHLRWLGPQCCAAHPAQPAAAPPVQVVQQIKEEQQEVERQLLQQPEQHPERRQPGGEGQGEGQREQQPQRRFIPQALSNMVWACAHLRNGTRGCGGPTSGGGPPTTVPRDSRPGWAPSPDFLEAVAGAATRCMADFQSQARLGRARRQGGAARSRRLLQRRLPQAHPCPALPAAAPQTLANLLWGYCKLDVYPEQLFREAAAELVERCARPAAAQQPGCSGGPGPAAGAAWACSSRRCAQLPLHLACCCVR